MVYMLVFFSLFFIMQLFALTSFIILDYIEKLKKHRLVSLNKWKYIFVCYKKYNPDIMKNKLGIISFIMQLFNIFISLLLIISSILCSLLPLVKLYYITVNTYILYIIISIVLMFILLIVSICAKDKIDK